MCVCDPPQVCLKNTLRDRHKTTTYQTSLDAPLKPLEKKDLMLIYTLGPKPKTKCVCVWRRCWDASSLSESWKPSWSAVTCSLDTDTEGKWLRVGAAIWPSDRGKDDESGGVQNYCSVITNTTLTAQEVQQEHMWTLPGARPHVPVHRGPSGWLPL